MNSGPNHCFFRLLQQLLKWSVPVSGLSLGTSKISKMQVWPCHCSCISTPEDTGQVLGMSSPSSLASDTHSLRPPIMASSHLGINKVRYLCSLNIPGCSPHCTTKSYVTFSFAFSFLQQS